MVDLNNAAAVRNLDSLKMLDLTMNYPKQFAEGFDFGLCLPLPPLPERIDEVVIFGTGGGSAASANLIRSYVFDRTSVPIISVQGYNAPGYVDRNTLVFAVSHSGKTEEILSAAAQALAKGATVIGLGAGGKLREAVRGAGAAYLDVPGGFMPRIAIGYIMIPIMVVLQRYGLIPDFEAEFNDAVALMGDLAAEYGPESPVASNQAKQLAEQLGPHIPVIYGFADQYDAVAWRIKNQLGENSKYMAFWNTIPHLHHDEAVGWDMQPELAKTLGFLLLRDHEAESDQMKKRWDATTEILTERMGTVATAWARGKGRLARMLSLVTLGDFFTMYMAIRKGVDPTPVAIIDLFKKKVGQ
ncbi:MAG TPA: bifunctional phosphoglucose/phosphomannose isomerase [Symbiobacteriaceae bacterium]|nr:bifunctional phosphoglucose/phosphomannose isomerase [Symbiobacteriaceae bacterium]